MKLSNPVKILVGIATAWICIYPLLFLSVWFMMATQMGLFGRVMSAEPPMFMTPFLAIFPVHCFTILLQFVMMAFYLIHVIKNNAAAEVIRIILGVGVFFLPYVAMPVYYVLYIWMDTPPAWAAAPSSNSIQAP